MPSVDCASLNSLVSEMPLSTSAALQSPEAKFPNEPIFMPAVSLPNPNNQQTAEEVLIPGKNWEYIAEYPLHNLKPHPFQKDLFVGLNATGIEELAEDIQKRGLQNPLEILPDGTLINGHQRFLAYKRLGLEQIPVYSVSGGIDSA